MFFKQNFLQCLHRFTKSEREQQQQERLYDDDNNLSITSSSRKVGGRGLANGDAAYDNTMQSTSFSCGNNNNSNCNKDNSNSAKEILIKRRTSVLFSTNRGLHIRVAKLGGLPHDSSIHLSTSNVLSTAHNEALRSSLPSNSLGSYDISFCDLERWSTNRAHTVNLEDTFTVLPRTNALRQQQNEQRLSLDQLPITHQTSLSSLSENNLSLHSLSSQNGCKGFPNFRNHHNSNNSSLNSLQHNNGHFSVNDNFRQSKRRSVHFRSNNNHNVARF